MVALPTWEKFTSKIYWIWQYWVLRNLYSCIRASLVAQMLKNLPVMQETWVWSLGWEDPLERGKATTPVFWHGEFYGLCSSWGCRVGYDFHFSSVTKNYIFTSSQTKEKRGICLGISVSKESSCSAEDLGSIPGSGRSPGEGNGNPLHYSCLENSMDRQWGHKELDMTD